MSDVVNVVHDIVEKISSSITYSASAITMAAGALTLNEWLAIGGFCLGLASFAFNVWFKMKYKRKDL